jgi:hypothetical protein
MDFHVFNYQCQAEWHAEKQHVEPEQALHENLGGFKLSVNNLLGRLSLIELKIIGRLEH